MIAEWNDEPEEERCPPGSECPQCGESRTDYLRWDEEGVQVTCDTCGHSYKPPQHCAKDAPEDEAKEQGDG